MNSKLQKSSSKSSAIPNEILFDNFESPRFWIGQPLAQTNYDQSLSMPFCCGYMEHTYSKLGENCVTYHDFRRNFSLSAIISWFCDHLDGHLQIELLLAVVKCILQSFECLVLKHLQRKKEHIAHVSWSLNVILAGHYHWHFVLGGAWCDSCMFGRNFGSTWEYLNYVYCVILHNILLSLLKSLGYRTRCCRM